MVSSVVLCLKPITDLSPLSLFFNLLILVCSGTNDKSLTLRDDRQYGLKQGNASDEKPINTTLIKWDEPRVMDTDGLG